MSDLVIDQGDDEIIDITVTDPDGDATELAGCKLWFYVKEHASDVDAAAIIAKSSPNDGITITSPTSAGKAEVAIADTDTAGLASNLLGRNLRWALQIRDGSEGALITTLARGDITINRDLISAVT